MRVFSSIVFCVVFCTGAALSSTCPLGSTQQDSYCFIAGKATAKYQHAQMYCLAYGCKVAVPYESMKTSLQSFGSSNSVTSNLVFGVLDSMSEGVFVVAPLGTIFNDTDWDSSQPGTNTNNNCLKINDLNTWKMSSTSCSGKYNFICDCGTATS